MRIRIFLLVVVWNLYTGCSIPEVWPSRPVLCIKSKLLSDGRLGSDIRTITILSLCSCQFVVVTDGTAKRQCEEGGSGSVGIAVSVSRNDVRLRVNVEVITKSACGNLSMWFQYCCSS
jgi:hypothetical protein